ncbi:MAG: TVP38/TMEM64 family protein, partial [Betaproteobacteria bacterium]
PPSPMTRKRSTKRRPAWGKLAAGAAVLVVLAVAWKYTPLADLLTRENVVAWARAASTNRWAPIAVVLAYTPAALLMFPRPFLTLLTIIAFGRWLGFAYSAAGIMLAAMATYYAGRMMRRQTVLRFAGDRFEEAAKVLREHGIAAVFASNQIPVPPFFLQGIIAGAIRMSAWQYAVGSALGMAPGLLAATLFAGELRAWLEDPSTINWWIVAAAAVAFVAFGWWVRRWFTRRMRPAS